jgi:hypothetical protein
MPRSQIGLTGTRTLLCREVVMKLGGGALLGRYGGGGPMMLWLSANGSGPSWLFDVMETMSEVSMPVRYAPFDDDPIGPSMIGWIWLEDVGGRWAGGAL